LAVLGLEAPNVVALQDCDQVLVSAAVCILPEGLRLWSLEDSICCLHRDVLQRARYYRCERLAVRREPLLDSRGRVRAREQRVDEVDGELLADLVVREHLPRGVRPRVRVERLSLHPDRERGEEDQDRRDDDQRPDGDRTFARERRGLAAGRGWGGAGHG